MGRLIWTMDWKVCEGTRPWE